MHMRLKKWARPELAACPWAVDEPEKLRGHWREAFPREAPFHLELGCGKGVATAAMIADNPGVNYLAIDISPDVLGDARPRRCHEKRRLTHPRQLMQYRALLPAGGEIWFKTDDDHLFEVSRLYFRKAGFEPVWETEDLHASGFTPNYVSEHERMFTAQGIPIKAGIWRKTAEEVLEDFTRWHAEPAHPPRPRGEDPGA